MESNTTNQMSFETSNLLAQKMDEYHHQQDLFDAYVEQCRQQKANPDSKLFLEVIGRGVLGTGEGLRRWKDMNIIPLDQQMIAALAAPERIDDLLKREIPYLRGKLEAQQGQEDAQNELCRGRT